MRFTNPYSTHLGTFTWAELQASYPNAGGALAALPAGITAFVSDWNVDFTPNAAKAAWSVCWPTRIVFDTTAQTGDLTGNDQVVKQALLPAAILRSGSKFVTRTAIGKNGTTDAATSSVLRLGPLGTTADPAMINLTTMAAGNRSVATENEFVLNSATQIRWTGAMNNASWSGAASSVSNPQAANISNLDSNALWLSLCVDIAGTTNAPQGFLLELELIP